MLPTFILYQIKNIPTFILYQIKILSRLTFILYQIKILPPDSDEKPEQSIPESRL